MKIQPLSQLYKQCRLPGVEKDIFGHPLNMSNVSDIFIKGQQVLITDYNKRFKRPQPLNFYLSWNRVHDYLKQFRDFDYVTKAEEALGKLFK